MATTTITKAEAKSIIEALWFEGTAEVLGLKNHDEYFIARVRSSVGELFQVEVEQYSADEHGLCYARKINK